MANEMNMNKGCAASRSAGYFSGDILEEVPAHYDECSTLDITIRLDRSVPIGWLETRTRDLLEERGVVLAIAPSPEDPDGSISAIFITYLTISAVANILLDMDGVDEVLIEARNDDRPFAISPGESGKNCRMREIHPQVSRYEVQRMDGVGGSRIVRPYRRRRRVIISGPRGEKENGGAIRSREFEQMRFGTIFDHVQNIFHALAVNYEKKIDLFMTGDRVEVRNGNEDALVFLMVHIVRHIIDEQIGEVQGRKADDKAHGEVNISAVRGRSRATIRIWGRSRVEGPRSMDHSGNTSVRSGGINGNGSEGSRLQHDEQSNGRPSLDLTIAAHLAQRKGWGLVIDGVIGQGTIVTLRLEPNRGVLKALVVLIDERFFAIDMDLVHWGVMVRSDELEAGRKIWQGEELPIVDLRATISNGAWSGNTIQGLVLGQEDAKVCALVSRSVGVQELALDAAVEGADLHKGRWGLLDSGLRVMLLGLEDIRPCEKR